MAYRYYQHGVHLEFYVEPEQQGSPPPPGMQPPSAEYLSPITAEDHLEFAPGEPDIRGFSVNTPNGDTLGTVVGLLADGRHQVVVDCYVKLPNGRTVVVPTDQIMMYSERRLVTLEGGIPALDGAPDAHFDARDAQRATAYWVNYRRQHAA